MKCALCVRAGGVARAAVKVGRGRRYEDWEVSRGRCTIVSSTIGEKTEKNNRGC